MTLLINRDKTFLEKCEGEAKVDKDVPAQLKQVHIVPQKLLLTPLRKFSIEDKLITTLAQKTKITKFLRLKSNEKIFALWAGYRSVIVECGNGELYKLKGVTVNLENPEIINELYIFDRDPDIFGAQYKYSAKYEQQMSGEFNKALKKEGIEPVMEFKGYWNYKLKVNDKPISASVIKIKGDTRLDELMDTIEEILFQKIMLNTPNKSGQKILQKVVTLYQDLGFVVGRLKRLMNKNNQSWGPDAHRTNSHPGNVVLYADKDHLRLGFVDFDASCSRKVDKLNEQEIKRLQNDDYYSIRSYVHKKQCSSRQLASDKYDVLHWRDNNSYNNFLRDTFCEGFKKGHDDETFDQKQFDNKIPLEQLMEINTVLKSGVSLLEKKSEFDLHGDSIGGFMDREYCKHICRLHNEYLITHI